MLTKLQAVNEILASIQQSPVTALDTGGVSTQAEAEDYLDTWTDRILSDGWQVNREFTRDLNIADNDFTVSSVSGTFTFEETLTGGTSSETAQFLYSPDGTSLFVRNLSGAFTASETITGGTSGETCTFTSTVALTQSKIAINSSWLMVEKSMTEAQEYSLRGNFLYDPIDNTDEFDTKVEAIIVTDPDFVDLRNGLQWFIVKTAALHFQRYKKKGKFDERVAQEEITVARSAAIAEDLRIKPVNLHKTAEHVRFIGNRRHAIFRSIR